MINVLSYIGMGLQSEVCLWTLLGLVRTIFDATLFKVNANLKQVWQMSMPAELSLPVQRVLRTMISGIMLVQCFTVYVYLASYIVLLYPVFLVHVYLYLSSSILSLSLQVWAYFHQSLLKPFKNHVIRRIIQSDCDINVPIRVPKDEVRRVKWVKMIRLLRKETNWLPTKSTIICSKHFLDQDKIAPKNDCGRVSLSDTAIPVIEEERPTLVLPWLLLAAIRKLLCELTSLALGLGTCVLLGAARPPCIKFVVIKVISIMPSFYMWMLLYSYYHALKVASVFKTFPVVLPPSEHDYGLELAVRRRRTKSLQGEDQLRRRLLSNFYNERHSLNIDVIRNKPEYSSRMSHATDTSNEDIKEENIILQPLSANLALQPLSDTGCYEDWFGEIMIPRDTDRILEQFGVMMLRIGAYMAKGNESNTSQLFNSGTLLMPQSKSNHDCTTMPPDDTDTPPLVGSSKERTASYLRDYPLIFRKKPSVNPLHSDMTLSLTADDRIAPSLKNQSQNDDKDNTISNRKFSTVTLSDEIVSTETETPSVSTKISFMEKKLQTKVSSDKSVSFEKCKSKITSTRRETNEVNHKVAETSNSTNLEEKDSLESIIEDIKKRRSFKIKSLNKDENNNMTHEKTTSKNNKSTGVTIHSDDQDSLDSLISNKSNYKNSPNRDNTNK